ncbi:MAG: UxaA family hydrolase, partial [Clostridia bacterium]|nr:UxaA family hydrolase [Clostridia bacterium]
PIGHATEDIQKGDHVHTHNVKTNLSGTLTYTYRYKDYGIQKQASDLTFQGYVRENGDVGIRNEIWIVNTVGCVNKIAQKLAELTGAQYFVHPFGCSQLGDDQTTTQLILKGMVNHPNAAGVLVLGLGCENNNIAAFKEVLGEYDERRVKFLNCQEHEDEIAAGVALIEELKAYAATFKPQAVPISRLRIGLKCGGSDGFSGITANPLVGSLSDRVIAHGGSCVLTEVPEMFGAEHLLMERCENEAVFDKTVSLINDFKEYYARHNQVIYENPSPGNKAGGITTLEEKSLGCVQKGGLSPVVDVLNYGDRLTKNGLSLLNGPGNDIVAVTNLMAAGVHMVLFTTGRGTPLGGAVPTVKIATNHALAVNKKNWIDFDASPLLDGMSMDDLTDALLAYVLRVASGEETNNEKHGYREISIFKDGVTL